MTAEAPPGVLDVLSERFRKRFYSRVKISSGCWLWQGQRTSKGYGRISLRKRVFRAHRVAWELANGPVPPDRWVLHRCHDRACVRVDHLYLGTAADNARDKYDAGRANHATKAKGNWRGGPPRKAGLARHGLLVLLTTAACAILALPAISSATPEIGQKHNGWSIADETYLRTYERCWKALKAECGRNIVDDGLASGKPPSEAQVEESTATMQRWLAPPEPEPTVASSISSDVAPSAPVTSTVAPASGDLASIAACESGGDYSTNTGNGYTGAYQFDDATWQAAGGSTASAYQASPAEQDAVAAGWIAAGNRGAWPNC